LSCISFESWSPVSCQHLSDHYDCLSDPTWGVRALLQHLLCSLCPLVDSSYHVQQHDWPGPSSTRASTLLCECALFSSLGRP
jgi:hypothetical protein